jgi:hypothetical protein
MTDRVAPTARCTTSTCRTKVSDVPPSSAHCPRADRARTLALTDGVPVLGPEASSGYFAIAGGTISLAGPSGTLYLNAVESVSTSYKPLVFNATATTTDWGLEGDTIIETNPRQINFLACPTSDSTIWSLYLQEGSDVPSSACANYMSLHLPCLC